MKKNNLTQQNRTDQNMQLGDGRTLGFAEYVPPKGTPIFYFSGGNSSRLEGQWFEEAANKNNIRLIVPDRPGFGISTFDPMRKLLDWPDDILALADYLGIGKFSVFGLSGGGPHVLATTYKIPARIKKAVIISGTAPPEMPDQYQGMWPPVRLIFLTAKKFPPVNRFLLKQMAGFYSNKEQMLKRMKQAMPIPDVDLIERRPDIIEIFTESTKEAHRDGIQGDALEWQIYVHPWGFELGEINLEVKLWYGIYDQQVPVAMGRYLADQLPRATLVEVENGGHFSTINNHIDEIFEYLKA